MIEIEITSQDRLQTEKKRKYDVLNSDRNYFIFNGM